MPDIALSLDPFNPGMVYACCGVLQALELVGDAPESYFTFDNRFPRQATFTVVNGGHDMAAIANELRTSAAQPLTRPNAPDPDPIAPVSLQLFGRQLTLDWWLDSFWQDAVALKFWAGQVTSAKLFTELPDLIPKGHTDLQSHSYTTTRIGADPRSAWESLDLGYSPNEQGQKTRAYPLTELLASLGLQSFRPEIRRYRASFSLWLTPLSPALARTSMLQPWPGQNHPTFEFEILRRGRYKYLAYAQMKEKSDE